jgi:hypothetical protein
MTNEELNAAIRDLCEQRGMQFAPHACPPWEADDGPSPWPAHTAGAESWPKAQALRRKLVAEIEAAPRL